jgi:hypothetical protein
MADPVTIGALVASALAMVGETALKGALGEAAKDAYKALRDRVARWTGTDVEALEKSPTSANRRAVIAEAIDGQPAEEQAPLRVLAEQLIATLKQQGPIGLDVGRLEALEVQLGSINVTEGIGARLGEAKLEGALKAGPINVGRPPGKS